MSSSENALRTPKWEVFYRTMWNYLPDSLLSLVSYTPTKEHRRIRRHYQISKEAGGKLLDEKVNELSSSYKGDSAKDVLSVLSTYYAFCLRIAADVWHVS